MLTRRQLFTALAAGWVLEPDGKIWRPGKLICIPKERVRLEQSGVAIVRKHEPTLAEAMAEENLLLILRTRWFALRVRPSFAQTCTFPEGTPTSVKIKL